MDVCVCTNGVTGWAGCSFMRWLVVCLERSNTGEHVAYIPAVRPTLTRSFSPSLRAGVTVPALNTNSCSYRSDGLSRFSTVCSNTSSQQISMRVCLFVEKKELDVGRRENKGNKYWGPCFSSNHFFLSVLPLYSPPTYPCLFVVGGELLWTFVVPPGESFAFFSPLFEHPLIILLDFYCTVVQYIIKYLRFNDVEFMRSMVSFCLRMCFCLPVTVISLPQ